MRLFKNVNANTALYLNELVLWKGAVEAAAQEYQGSWQFRNEEDQKTLTEYRDSVDDYKNKVDLYHSAVTDYSDLLENGGISTPSDADKPEKPDLPDASASNAKKLWFRPTPFEEKDTEDKNLNSADDDSAIMDPTLEIEEDDEKQPDEQLPQEDSGEDPEQMQVDPDASAGEAVASKEENGRPEDSANQMAGPEEPDREQPRGGLELKDEGKSSDPEAAVGVSLMGQAGFVEDSWETDELGDDEEIFLIDDVNGEEKKEELKAEIIDVFQGMEKPLFKGGERPVMPIDLPQNEGVVGE